MAAVVDVTSSKFLSWRFVVQVLVLLQHIANSQTLVALSLTIGSKVTVTTSTASSLVIPGATSASCFIGNSVVLQPTTARHSCSTTISMVEGHSVHRVATLHRKRLVGKCFQAWSPNGRFTDGAAAIDGKPFTSIEAVGKNLFAFFGGGSDADSNKKKKQDTEVVVVHVHFGMAGAWAVYDTGTSSVPAPTKTNRLRLEALTHGGNEGGSGSGLVADLSAMTVQYGGMDLYTAKRSKLGEDPLRDDAQPDLLWTRVQKSKKSIGALIMDQSYFTGPGNIYRAEILFKAGLHPNRLGNTLSRTEFETVWYHTVDLLRRGYHTGSIITVDPDEARDLGQPTLRRYIYNTAQCPRCATPIQAWQIASRTCYACPNCQPLTTTVPTAAATNSTNPMVVTPDRTSANSSRSQDKSVKTVIPFNSHCARESVSSRLAETGPTRLTVQELKEQLTMRCIPFPKNAKKATLVDLFATVTTSATTTSSTKTRSKKSLVSYEGKTLEFNSAATATPTESSSRRNNSIVSSEKAALEKALAGENLAVEHIAELAPAQARAARAKATAIATAAVATSEKSETSSTIETKDDEERRRSIAQQMTVPELKSELTFRKVPFLSKAKKATLIDLLLLSSSAISEKEDVILAAATAVKKPTTTKKEKETRGGGRRSTDRQQRRSKRIKLE